MTVQSMAQAPWQTLKNVPTAVTATPGQLELYERYLYYWMARDIYKGEGEIVEIGALVGASSSCLAQGIVDNPRVADKRKRLNVFDKFETYPHLVDVFFPSAGINGYKSGEDFSPVYRNFTCAFENQINLTKIDITDISWHGAPIEILFVDCAVTPALSEKVIQVFCPYLIPGRSFVIDQDFFLQSAWWYAYKAQALLDVLAPVYSEDCTLVSHCRGEIGPSRLGLNMTDAPLADRIKALEALEVMLPGDAGLMAAIQRSYCLADSGDRRGASAILRSVWKRTTSKFTRYRVAAVDKRFKLQEYDTG